MQPEAHQPRLLVRITAVGGEQPGQPCQCGAGVEGGGGLQHLDRRKGEAPHHGRDRHRVGQPPREVVEVGDARPPEQVGAQVEQFLELAVGA